MRINGELGFLKSEQIIILKCEICTFLYSLIGGFTVSHCIYCQFAFSCDTCFPGGEMSMQDFIQAPIELLYSAK